MQLVSEGRTCPDFGHTKAESTISLKSGQKGKTVLYKKCFGFLTLTVLQFYNICKYKTQQVLNSKAQDNPWP